MTSLSRALGGLTSADTVVSLVLPPAARDPVDGARAVEQVRQGYRSVSGGDCDVILLAVPAGKGEPYVDDMADAVESTSGLIIPGRR